ncbi:MAG: hypothetical protein ABI461_15455, partial [Polyangiaceae bacterium]
MYLGAFCMLIDACGGEAPDAKTTANSPANVTAAHAPLATDAPTAGGADKQRERLEAAHDMIKSNYTPKGKSDRYGHAEVIVNAPIAELRKAVLDFANYKNLAPDKFKTVRMVAKENGTVDLYFLVPVMKGMMTIWYVARFPDHLVKDKDVELLDGRFVKGSIDDMELELTLRSIEPNQTILTCDLLIVPSIPAPQSALDETFRDAAGDAVAALKKRVESVQETQTVGPPRDMSQPDDGPQPQAAPAPASSGSMFDNRN